MKNKNIIIVIVDSARYYSTGGKDDRDKLDMMFDFEKESIYFSHAVSSAPSSVMSAGALFTGLDSYYISRNYDDFRYDNDVFLSLPNILENNNYEIKSIYNSKELRDNFGDLTPEVSEKFWPDNINYNDKRWSNFDCNVVLDNFLSNRSNKEKPLFLMIWYNIRKDPTTSSEMEKNINILKKYGYFDDSIYLLAADHGYMDPKRGYTPEWLKENGLTHDLIMTDDNIRIPMYLKYPGSQAIQIDEQVGNIDVLPTLLDLLNIEYKNNQNEETYSMSLLPLIDRSSHAIEKFNKRKIRSDGRFFAQYNRSTTLRTNEYKYTIRPDLNKEEFHDLSADPFEENNLINNDNLQSLINEFRLEYENSEDQAIRFQTKILLDKFIQTFDVKKYGKSTKILLLGFAEKYYLENILNFFPDKIESDIDLVVNEEFSSDSQISKYNHIFYYSNNRVKINGRYDLVITLFDSRNREKYLQIENYIFKQIKFSKKIYLDSNMEIKKELSTKSFKDMYNILILSRRKYIRDPKIFLNHIKIGFSILTKKIFR